MSSLAVAIDWCIMALVIRPLIARLHGRTDLRKLSELLSEHPPDPETLFAPPTRPEEVRITPVASRTRAFDLTWRSVQPSGHANNDLVRARLLLAPGRPDPREAGVPGPTLIVVPGWLTKFVEQYEFLVGRHALAEGANALVLETPWHHRRTPAGFSSGVLALSGDLVRSANMLGQAVADVGSATAWLRSVGCKRVGVFGESLGGWISALYAARTEDADLLVSMVPPVRIAELFHRSPMLTPLLRDVRASGVRGPVLNRLLDRMSPLNFELRVPRERVLLVEATHDAMLPGDGVRALWEHWGRPELVSLPHGHISLRFAEGFRNALRGAVRTRLVEAS
jgi:acetyl esterase/lipase